MTDNWTIYKTLLMDYAFILEGKIVYQGTYTQCLIILGGLSSRLSLTKIIELADSIPSTNEMIPND